ncbi:MAG: dihydroorotate dehydrogenase [Candidatus Goldbacteria bacterium]|nr:dihydroorotate dehydrogenase [Candidatus Goldiibacteriota bacterium]HPD18206.1 dihydroorotate dehydrogenase [Candidatus Goldiibacteriota bacterium]
MNMQVNIGKLKLKNPVMTASGTFGYGVEFENFFDLNKLGAIIVKGLSFTPVKGNPPQRIVETPAGMLNAIGLQNIGVKNFISQKLPLLEKYDTTVIANVYGRDVEEYVKVAEILNDTKVSGVELNISCPNVKKGGLQFASDKRAIEKIIKGVRKKFKKTVIVKLSPNTGNIEDVALHCERCGADAVSLINTIIGMAIDVNARKPVLANVFGGLSGPAIKPVALAAVFKVARKVRIPVIGIGGIMNYKDVLEFLIAGATAVQVGTANFIDPMACVKIINDLHNYLNKNKICDIKNIIGSIKPDKGY